MGIERIVTQFKRVIDGAQSREALHTAMVDMTQWLGFRHFAIMHHVDIAATKHAIRLHNYPDRWVDYYESKALGLIDPVHRTCHMTTEGFWWSGMSRLIRLTERDDGILRLGRIHGIGEGFTIPNNLPGEVCGSCTFSAESGLIIDPVKAALAQLAGLAAFGAAHRLWPRRGAKPVEQRPRLTPRQLDCLQYIAQGMNDREIAKALGITEETAACHIRNLLDRYGVKKRTSLLVHALLDGTIMVSQI